MAGSAKKLLRRGDSKAFHPHRIWSAMKTSTISFQAMIAEFIAMTMFVYVGCGTAVGFSTNQINTFAQSAAVSTGPVNGTLIQVLESDLKILGSFGITTALAFGLAIAVLIYAISHISGGHLNPAVTFGLFLSGHCGWLQMIGNMVAQFAGSCLAAGLIYGTTPNASSSSLGANSPSKGVTNGNAVLGEIVMTCVLVFTVHMCAVDRKNKTNVGQFAPLAIGLAVFIGHAVLIPVDGCSINPARSFGPAAVSGDWAGGRFWIFVVGPFVGSIFAVICYFILASSWEEDVAAEIGVDRTSLDEGNQKPSPKPELVTQV